MQEARRKVRHGALDSEFGAMPRSFHWGSFSVAIFVELSGVGLRGCRKSESRQEGSHHEGFPSNFRGTRLRSFSCWAPM